LCFWAPNSLSLVAERTQMQDRSEHAPTLAFVVPCYNEEAVIEELLKRLQAVSEDLLKSGAIRQPATLVLVDDGSIDRTWKLIHAASKSGLVRGVRLSRNHGHQAALLAGLMAAKEEVLISLDADLQDDPSAIPKMLQAYALGADIVFGVRASRKSDTFFKRRSARLYYKLLENMGVDVVPDHADYRLMSRKSVETLREYGEVNLFLRGIIKNLGYQVETVEYDRVERFAGDSKYPLTKMLRLAIEGVTSFSTRPLRYVTWIGLIVALISFLLGCYSIVIWWQGGTVPGWTSIVVPTFMLGSFQLIALGIVGEYLGKIYLETKRRPQFIIDEIAEPEPPN